ncbi:GTP-binding protein [Candidatus Nitronereus thalassa]|uniref:sulfate adenylyltransferase n=1 Tax=Candidatus Nitronereus thalassa TaxID=3020898 RepID=A0ABU3K8E3_9BACT|nr:GTP-binding protein [Candidatus Nitronereus thalassa]MDT7042665.1 GTP-binding protein [Candidatus Nitronereus thalassa]
MATCNPETQSAPDIRDRMNIVIVGHVDHGKSTLLGRLYADTGTLPEGKVEKIQAICKQQGKEFEYAFLFDAFLEEQQQGITIDTARTFFQWAGRQYIIIDAPGHKEFLKNMVSGAARAEAALLLIDALEGVRDQSKRHGLLLSMLGVKQVTVVVNKMDLVGYRQDTFDSIEKEYRDFLGQLNVTPQFVIPASAKLGDNIATPSAHMSWFTGPTVLDSLAEFSSETAKTEKPLRFPLQDVYKFDARRILAGRITSGRLKVGDRLICSPSNKTAVVQSIEAFNIEPPPAQAVAGQSIGITLDEQIFVERGEVVSHETSLPLVSTTFRANLFWLGRRPLEMNKQYLVRLGTQEVECQVSSIHRIVDANDLSLADQEQKTSVQRNEVADISIRAKSPLAFDLYTQFETTGRFVLIDNYDVAGGGIITEMVQDREGTLRVEAQKRDFAWVQGDVTLADRAKHYGHRAALVLLVGPNATGKTFLSKKLESLLVAEGRHAYMLDPENLRRGLDADLHKEEALEFVRRYGEVARLLVDTGLVVISTTNSFHLPADQAIEAIRTLVHPTPILTAYMSKDAQEPLIEADLSFTGPEDFTTSAHEILEALKRKGILAEALGNQPAFQFSI